MNSPDSQTLQLKDFFRFFITNPGKPVETPHLPSTRRWGVFVGLFNNSRAKSELSTPERQ